MTHRNEKDLGSRLPPRPVFTCKCGRYFLDTFSFGKHYDECAFLPARCSHPRWEEEGDESGGHGVWVCTTCGEASHITQSAEEQPR